MLRFVEMLPCMLMRGGIATADVTAGETQAQMIGEIVEKTARAIKAIA